MHTYDKYIYVCVCACVCVCAYFTYIYICIYIYIYIKLATVAVGDPRAPFSIDTTPKCDCSTLPLIRT